MSSPAPAPTTSRPMSSHSPRPPQNTDNTPNPITADATDTDGGRRSPPELATMLAQALKELERTKVQRDDAQKRAEDLLAASLTKSASIHSDNNDDPAPGPDASVGPTSNPPTATSAPPVAADPPNHDAQPTISDLNSRLKSITDAWHAYDRWATVAESRAGDARRVISQLIASNEEHPFPPHIQAFHHPNTTSSTRRQSMRPVSIYSGNHRPSALHMHSIPPGAPGGPPTSTSHGQVPSSLPPVPIATGVVAGRVRPREPSPSPLPSPTPRRLSNEEDADHASYLTGSGEREGGGGMGARTKRARQDPSPNISMAARRRFEDRESPRGANGQFVAPQYTFAPAQQHQHSPPSTAAGTGGAPSSDYPPPSPYPRTSKPRTAAEYESQPQPPQSARYPPDSHQPPPLHISPDRDRHPYARPHPPRDPHEHLRRESDRDSTLASAITPTSAATTASARSNGSVGMMMMHSGRGSGSGSKDSYPPATPYSARPLTTAGTDHEESLDWRSSPPPMQVMDRGEGGRRSTYEGEDAPPRRTSGDRQQRVLKAKAPLRVEVAPHHPASKREPGSARRRSDGDGDGDHEMRDAEGEEDNEDKDSVEEFLTNAVDDEMENEDQLQEDQDRDLPPDSARHYPHHLRPSSYPHPRGISPHSTTADAYYAHHPPRSAGPPHSAREWKDRGRDVEMDVDLPPPSAQPHHQRRGSTSSRGPPYHSDRELAPIQHSPSDMNNQFYAANGLVKSKGERSGDPFRHYSTPGSGGGREAYSPYDRYPRSPAGGGADGGGSRAYDYPSSHHYGGRGSRDGVDLRSPVPVPHHRGAEGGGVEYVQQPSGGGGGRPGTSLPHLLPTPTPTSAKSAFDFSAQQARQGPGHVRRHSASTSTSPTTATSLPSVNALMLPSPLSAQSQPSPQQGPPPRHAGPGPAVKPTFNEKGERICRACGQPGRYRDGKCVEKWGPGPAGPGTVCDRCRKKMKRVERRGTIEAELARRLPGQYYGQPPQPVPPLQHHATDEPPPSASHHPPQQPPPPPTNHHNRTFRFQPPLTAAPDATGWTSNREGVTAAGKHGRSGSFSGAVTLGPPKHKTQKEKERRRTPTFSPSPPPPKIASETRRKSSISGGESTLERAAADLMADADLPAEGDQNSPAGTTLKNDQPGEGGEEDGDGEEEEDAMGEAEEDADGAGNDVASTKAPANGINRSPPQAPPSQTRPGKDEHPPLVSDRSPGPGWVKLEDEDAAKKTKANAAIAAT